MKLSKIALLSALMVGLVGGVAANDVTIETETSSFGANPSIEDISPSPVDLTSSGVTWTNIDFSDEDDTIELRVYDPNGNERDSETRIASDDIDITLNVDFDEEGTWEAEVENFDGNTDGSETFQVEEPTSELEITRLGDNSPVFEGQDLEVDYEVENVGVDGEADAWLMVEGQEEDRITHNLNEGETQQDTFTYTTSQTGEFDYWIRTEDSADGGEGSREFNEDPSDDSDGILAGGWTTLSPEGYYHDNANIHDNFQLEEGETRQYIVDEVGSGADAHWMLANAPQTSWESSTSIDNEIYSSGQLDSYSPELNRIEVEWSGDTVSYEIFDEKIGGNQIMSDSADVSGEDEIYFSNYEWSGGGGTGSLRLIQIGGQDPYTFEVEGAEPTVTSTSPNEGEEFSPDTTSVTHSADIDYDGADSVDIELEVNGDTVLSLDDFSDPSVTTDVSEPSVDFNAGDTYSSEWTIERDGEVDDTDTVSWELEEWDIQFNNLQPAGDTFSFSDREIDFSVDINTNADDFSSYEDTYGPFDLEVLGDGISPTTIDLSEGTNTVNVESDVGTHDYGWEASIEGDVFTSDQESYTVEEPDLDVEFVQPTDGETFTWDTDEVLHEIEVTADGQEVDIQIVRNGTLILDEITEVDGTQSFSTLEPVDRDTYYEWGYEVTDDYQDFGETGSSSYSIEDAEEVTLSNEDVNPDRAKEGDEVEFSITASSPDVDVDEIEVEYADQNVDLLQSGEDWSREHTVPSTVSEGVYDVTFTSEDELGREESTTIEDGLEIDNSPPETQNIFIEWSEDGISLLSNDFDNNAIFYIEFDEPFEELGEVTFESTDLGVDITEDKSEWTEVDLGEGETPDVEDISYYESDGTVDVMYVTSDLGDREEEVSGSTTYSDDLGNSDSFSQTFVIDNIAPRLSNFEADNLDRASNFYVEGDEIEFSIDVEDFSDVNVNFFNDAFNFDISGTESDGTWTGSGVVDGDVEALEEQDVEVEANDEFGNEEIEFFSSGLEQAPDVEIVSQSIDVEEDEINHSVTTNTQLESITAELGSEVAGIEDYTETDVEDGFLYEIDNFVSDDGYFTLNEISVEDTFGQTTTEDVENHLVDTTVPVVEPEYYGSFESGTEPRGEVVSNDGEISWSNLGVSDNVALQEVEIEIDGVTEHTETFELDEEVTFYDEELSFEVENNEYYTVEITASDHRDNTVKDTTEVYVFEYGDIPVERVEWTEDTLYREQTRSLEGEEYYVNNQLEIEIEDVEFDWYSRSYGNYNDIRFELDDQFVSRPGYGQSVYPTTVTMAGGWATRVGDEVLYRNADFTTTFEDVGDKRWFSDTTGFIYYEDEDNEVESSESFSYESIDYGEDTVTYTYHFDMVDDTGFLANRYNERINGEVEGFVKLEELEEEVVVSDTFKLEEKIEVNNLRVKSDVEDVTSEISFNSNFDDILMEDLVIMKDASDRFTVHNGREYEFDGSEWNLVEETDDLREPTGDLENPEDGDRKWNFTISNNYEEEIEVLDEGEVIAVIEGNGEQEMTCESDIGCFSDVEEAFLGETVQTTSIDTLNDVYTAEEEIYSESNPELQGEYRTDSFPVERGEFEARFNLVRESADLERNVSKSFKVREDTFKGKFYQFFENSLDWSDNFTGAVLLITSVIGGMILVSLYLGFFPATMFGLGIGIGWLYLGFLPLALELAIVVGLAGILTIFFRWVKG